MTMSESSKLGSKSDFVDWFAKRQD